jgi:hypothetical protein
MGEQDTYAAHVVAYLNSDPGRDTPSLVAARLLALGPGQMGMSTPPSPAQLHNTRQALEDIEPETAEERECITGVWCRTAFAIRVA